MASQHYSTGDPLSNTFIRGADGNLYFVVEGYRTAASGQPAGREWSERDPASGASGQVTDGYFVTVDKMLAFIYTSDLQPRVIDLEAKRKEAVAWLDAPEPAEVTVEKVDAWHVVLPPGCGDARTYLHGPAVKKPPAPGSP